MSKRIDGRGPSDLRPVIMEPGFHKMAEGSVLYRSGNTVVLCTASIDNKVPPFLEGKGKGWLTAEYQMHPRSNPVRRESRDGRGKALGGRTQEIQRLIGRALRAAVRLDALGERTLAIDCDVLEADGGTRTASVTGGFVAAALALSKLMEKGGVKPGILREPVAAVSVGLSSAGAVLLDLPYVEDKDAEVDLNVVATESGLLIELQGTAEGEPVARATIDRMIDVAVLGIANLTALQKRVLAAQGVPDSLFATVGAAL